jgi:hypothetical protein
MDRGCKENAHPGVRQEHADESRSDAVGKENLVRAGAFAIIVLVVAVSVLLLLLFLFYTLILLMMYAERERVLCDIPGGEGVEVLLINR